MEKFIRKNPHKDKRVLEETLKKISLMKLPPEDHYCPECDLLMNIGINTKTCIPCDSLKREYNLTWKQYMKIFNEQDGVCDICRIPERRKDKYGEIRRLCIDHDHETGKIRGLLCATCNSCIGMAHDNIYVLLSAIQYLKKHGKGY